MMEAAALFLGVRPRSVEETRRRLKQLGYRESLVDQVVERLLELGYLDDRAFVAAWVESRDRARPRGQIALRRELALKGVDRPLVDAALDERAAAGDDPAAPDPDLAAAGRLIERRHAALMREPDPRRRRQRAYALLARNGFDPETCRAVSLRVAEAAAEEREAVSAGLLEADS